ncbi:MAG: hypothetical protein Q4F18_15345, partial [Clostridia bacterium]|nr:hypothetical protein [Clostridia bacterium]
MRKDYDIPFSAVRPAQKDQNTGIFSKNRHARQQKSAPCALPLPKRFTLQSVSVLAARFFAQFPISSIKRAARAPTSEALHTPKC